MSWGLKHFWSQFQVPEQVFPWKLHEKSFYLLNICYLIHNFKLNCYFFCTFRCSVAQSCPTLCDPMDCSMPGFPVLHCLLEFAQARVHWVGDAIQPSHPPSPPSPAFSLSHLEGLFQWVSSSHQVAKVLELQLQYQSFQ